MLLCRHSLLWIVIYADRAFLWKQVQRVKNKWKTVFKDGMIHLNGKDYLFAKCNGYVQTARLFHCSMLTIFLHEQRI